MNEETLKEMTNADLKAECKELGISNVLAKNPGKPNKTEYIAAIIGHLNYEGVAVETSPVQEEAKEVAKPEPKNTHKKQSPAQLARLDMFRKDRVVIHDIQENQSKDKDEILSISWGNRLLGGQTDFVALNGQPQYIRRGAIKNMMDATTVIHNTKAGGSGVTSERVSRFVISEVGGLSPKELEELANKQKLRNSKYA